MPKIDRLLFGGLAPFALVGIAISDLSAAGRLIFWWCRFGGGF